MKQTGCGGVPRRRVAWRGGREIERYRLSTGCLQAERPRRERV